MDDRGAGKRPARLLWWLGGLVAVVLVTGAILGALRGPATLDPDSPEGVVQSYLQAVLDGDYQAAVQHFSEETAERCTVASFREAWIDESLTATLEDVRVRDGGAEVRIRFRSVPAPDPLGGDFSFRERFSLVEEAGAWRLTGDPWPLFFCPERP